MILEFMFNRIFNNYCDNNIWNILIFLSVFLVILALFRIGKKGSWSEIFFSKDYFKENKIVNYVNTKKKKRR